MDLFIVVLISSRIYLFVYLSQSLQSSWPRKPWPPGDVRLPGALGKEGLRDLV